MRAKIYTHFDKSCEYWDIHAYYMSSYSASNSRDPLIRVLSKPNRNSVGTVDILTFSQISRSKLFGMAVSSNYFLVYTSKSMLTKSYKRNTVAFQAKGRDK